MAGSAPSTARQGCRDSIAVIVAYVPFGLALGATLASTGLNPLLAWSTSPLFGGAAQLLSVQLLDAGANAAVVVLGALVVNADGPLQRVPGPHTSAWPAR
jgi:predicted branched-subunit amino acid permease